MKCFECGSKNMTVAREDIDYDCGLGVTLADVDVARCPDCGEWEHIIEDPEGLHQSIADVLVMLPRTLTGPEVRFLRTFLGWSGRDFARKMGVTPETVSRWESRRDKRSITSASERLLRIFAAANLKTVDYEQPASARDDLDARKLATVLAHLQDPVDDDRIGPDEVQTIRFGSGPEGWVEAK